MIEEGAEAAIADCDEQEFGRGKPDGAIGDPFADVDERATAGGEDDPAAFGVSESRDPLRRAARP